MVAFTLVLATLVRLALAPVLGANYPFITYLGAVALVAWVQRTPEASITLLGGAVLALWLFVPHDGGEWLGVVLFAAVSCVIVAMSHAMRGARAHALQLLTASERQRNELQDLVEVVSAQREGLRTTLGSIADAVLAIDATGRITSFNPAAAALLRCSDDEASGVRVTEVLRVTDAVTGASVENPGVQALRDGTLVTLAEGTLLTARDGTVRPVAGSAVPIRGQDGSVTGAVVVLRDITERLDLDRARREAEERIAATLESVTDAFIRCDRDWRIVYVNAEAERINGIRRDDAIGQTIWEMFPAVVGTPVEWEFRRAVRDQVTVEFENLYEPWQRWYAIRCYPSPDGGLTTYTRDITAQKAQHDALASSEARFRELADAMPQIVYSCGLDGRVDFANRQWREYTGQSEAQTADLGAVVHPDDLEGMVREWNRAKSSGTTFAAEFRLRREADGEYRWFLTRCVPLHDAAGVVVKWFGTSTDIDDQKRTVQALAESEARYRAIGESMDFGVWVCDAAGRNTYASDSFLRLLGLTQEQWSEVGWWDALHPDDLAATRAAWAECVRTHGTWDRMCRLRGVDGAWYTVLARGVPLRDAAGQPLGWAGLHLDVSRLAESEREVARLAEASERQRRLYETVLSSTPDFVYVFSLDHRVVYANDALITMWGRGYEGAIGKTFLEIGYEPWHAEMHEREIDEVQATRRPIRGEVPFTGAFGTRQYEYIFVPVFGADGAVEAVAGTTRDVTDRRRSDEQMRANEERQSFLVTLADTIRPLRNPLAVQADAAQVLGQWLGADRVAYFEVRGDEYVIERDYSDGTLSLVGRYPTASFGSELLDAYRLGRTAVSVDVHVDEPRPPHVLAAFDAIRARAYVAVPLIKDGAFVAGLAVHTSQPRRWTATEVAIIEETAERTWAAVEQVRVEMALRESEERFRTLFTTMDEGFSVLDLAFDDEGRAVDYRIELANPAFEKHTGMAGLVGRSIREAVPTLEEFWFETYGRVASTGDPVRFVKQAGPLDGRWFDVAAFRLGPAGSSRVAVLFNDISARVAAEADRERLVSELRSRDRSKDEFLATLAHELRNPLAPMRNALQLIELAGSHGIVERARLIMERQLVQMTRLVDDLLDASRVTTGKLDLRRERVELRDVITAAVETSRPLIEQHGHDLAVVILDGSLAVHGDPVRLAQVVSNLLTNAAKYTHHGGHIRVRAGHDQGTVVVTVTDDGIGIPADMLESVFGMFTQVDRTLEKTTGGLGIGLSLVKGLVEMHDGTIVARSEGEGHGSEFELRLPMADVPAQDTHRAAVRAEPVRSSVARRILIIDDNVDSAQTLGELMAMLGHDVRIVHDGDAGLAVATEFRPDIVVCDIGMPKVNGYDVARRIRAQDWSRGTVLIALTGWGQDTDVQNSEKAGFDHHLVKPVVPATMATLVTAARLA